MTRQGKQRHRNSARAESQQNLYKRFASVSATKTGTSTASARGVTESRLKTMLQDPRVNATQIAMVSKNMKQTNGAYKQILRYLSNMLTYDHTLYPSMDDPMSLELALEEENEPLMLRELKKGFAQTAIYLDRYNIKYHLPLFTAKMFTNGVVYLYKLEDSKSISYMELPINLCRISKQEEGVYRYQFNITSINSELFEVLPTEIQKAYNTYQEGNAESLNLEENQWYQLSDKAVAFTVDEDVMVQGGIGVPTMASSLIDSIRIENAKSNMESDNELDNMKIIHSQIETDDKGRPLMELPVVMEYHNALKQNLPAGVVAITNPFNTNSVSLSGSTGKDGKFALLEKATEQFYKGVGVSQQLFGGDNASSVALERSIQVDCQFMYSTVLPLYANYYNYELKKAGKKRDASWKIKFLPISYFFRDDAISTAKDQLSWGGSRLEYLASTGMTPLEVANMLVFEQVVLSIDDYMIAKQTSYTQSGGDGKSEDSEAGRPESDNPTDTTVRIKDSQ